MNQAEGPGPPPTALRAGCGLTPGSSEQGRLHHVLQGLGQSRRAGHQDEDASPALSRCSRGRRGSGHQGAAQAAPANPPGTPGAGRAAEPGAGAREVTALSQEGVVDTPITRVAGRKPRPAMAEACKPLEAENRGFHQNPHWLREPTPARSAVGSQPAAPGPRLPPRPPHSHPCNS